MNVMKYLEEVEAVMSDVTGTLCLSSSFPGTAKTLACQTLDSLRELISELVEDGWSAD